MPLTDTAIRNAMPMEKEVGTLVYESGKNSKNCHH